MAPSAVGDLIELGEIMGTHGIGGELRVRVHNPSSDLLLRVPRVHVIGAQPDAASTEFAVRSSRVHGKGLLMRLTGVRDREQARGMFGLQLAIPRSELPEPADDEFYLVDTIGARVELEDGTPFGVIESFRSYPTTDVLCVRSEDGLRELPVMEPYLVEARVDEGVVVVAHIEDLELEPERARR